MKDSLQSSMTSLMFNEEKTYAFKRKTVGYKKLKEGRNIEDSVEILRLKNATICAVADGHGDAKCKFSDKGAQIATKVAIDTFRTAYESCPDEKTLYEYFANNRERIIQQIIREWNKAIYMDYISMKEPNESDIEEMLTYLDSLFQYSDISRTSMEARRYFEKIDSLENSLRKISVLYGTTLNIVFEMETFIFCIGIGDGDIIAVTKKNVDWLLPPSEQFSTRTNSLCLKPERAYKEFRSVILRKTKGKRKSKLFETKINPDYIIVSSDGLRNSFVNDEYFISKLIEINEERTSDFKSFQDNSQAWIEQLTKDSMFQDDISFGFLYKKQNTKQ